MSYKNKIKMSTAKSIAIGATSGVVLQLVCGGIIAMLVEKGSVPEGSVSIAAVASRSIGLLAGLIITWWLSPDKRLTDLMITCGSLLLLPLVLSLLFWDVDVAGVAFNAVLSLVLLGCSFWLLNQNKKGKSRSWRKRGYR